MNIRPALLWKHCAALAIMALLLAGCKQGADAFFSGRPSEHAMVHNRIIAGGLEEMLVLLRVPARFPDASVSHIGNWQESTIAWWWHAEKHDLMLAAFGRLTPTERAALKTWVAVKIPGRSGQKAKALAEMEMAINSMP